MYDATKENRKGKKEGTKKTMDVGLLHRYWNAHLLLSIFFLFFPPLFLQFLEYNSNDYSYSIMDATMESGYSFGCATY